MITNSTTAILALLQVAFAIVATSFVRPSLEDVSLPHARITHVRGSSIDSIVNDTASATKLLVGRWQKGGWGFAAGWTDNYQFFPDGRFQFNYNEMDCAKREVSYSGSWQLRKGFLRLIVRERHVLVGGHMEDSYGSCASDSSLEGATLERIVVNPPQSLSLRFDGIRIDQFRDDSGQLKKRYYMELDSHLFSRMKDDPSAD